MEYLDVKNSRRSTEPSAQLSYASTGSEFAAFFAKKKPQRAKQSLFKYGSLLLIQHSILLWFIWKLFVQYYFILQWSPSFICKKSLKKEETNLSLTCLFLRHRFDKNLRTNFSLNVESLSLECSYRSSCDTNMSPHEDQLSKLLLILVLTTLWPM